MRPRIILWALVLIGLLMPFSMMAQRYLTQAEYFVDADPGVGNGIPLLAVDGSLNEAIEEIYRNNLFSTVPGPHTLNIRVKDAAGNWGPVYKTVFYVGNFQPRALKVSLAEIFWDTDPGAGNGTPMIAFDGAFDEAIETAILGTSAFLTQGMHKLHVRVKDPQGNWGPAFVTAVQVTSSLIVRNVKINSGEIFWDNDPGLGLGTPLIAFDGNFDEALETLVGSTAAGLSQGMHKLFVRVKDGQGSWGPTFTQAVYVSSALNPRDLRIAAGELFWDNDPGQGLGVPLIAFDGNFDEAVETAVASGLSSLTQGLHTLNVRVKDPQNTWGPVFKTAVYVGAQFNPRNLFIASGEIFWDTDPGAGNGIPMIAFNGNFDKALQQLFVASTVIPDTGMHVLGVRVKDSAGLWGPAFTTAVRVQLPFNVRALGIIAGEYFFNSDPGYGAGMPLVAFSGNLGEALQTLVQETAFALDTGFHVLNVRVMAGDSVWSPVFRTALKVLPCPNIPVVTVSPSSPQNICPGDSVALTAAAGFVSYKWFKGSTLVGTGPVYYAKSTGFYRVYATNTDGCSAFSDFVQVTVDVLNPGLIAYGPTSFCEGSSVYLSAASGFQSYLWNNGSTTQGIYVTTSGYYKVTVSNGTCQASDSILVTVYPLPPAPVITPSGPTTFCPGSSLVLTSSPAVAYSWNTGATTQNITVYYGGTYSVTIFDLNGCSNSSSITVTNYPAPITSVSPGTSICVGDSTQLWVNGSGVSFNWVPAIGLSHPTNYNTMASPPVTTLYKVYVTGVGGCQDSAQVLVSVNPLPSVTASASPTEVCEGGSIQLTATSSNATSFHWTGPNGYSSWQQNPLLSGLTLAYAGRYTVTAYNSYGCSATSFVDISVLPAPGAVATTNAPLCEGSTLELYGAPGAQSDYAWSGPNGFTSNIQNPVLPAAGLGAAGTYYLTVTGANGCQSTASVYVQINPIPDVVLTASPNPVCEAGTLHLYGQPGGMTTYAWTGPAGFTSSLQNPILSSIQLTGSGYYKLTVTDAIGCTNSDSIQVTVNPLPVPVITFTSNPVCEGSTVTLSGPAGMANYTWRGPANFNSNQQSTDLVNVGMQNAGVYHLSVTNSFGCTDSIQASLQVLENPVVVASAVSNPVCMGDTLFLTAFPDTAQTYQWTGPAGFSAGVLSPFIANTTAANAGTYQVTATYSNGCQRTATVPVAIQPLPVITMSATPNPVCEGNSLFFTASGAGSGGTYAWTGPNGFLSTQQFPVIASVQLADSGWYYLTATDVYGCHNRDSLYISVLTAEPVTVSASPNPVCEGGTVDFKALPGTFVSYLWSGPNGFTATGPTATLTGATLSHQGLYSVIATASNGCQRLATVYLTVNPVPVISLSATPNPACEGASVQLKALPNGMTSYAWTGPSGYSSTTQSPVLAGVVPSQSGYYSVLVTHPNGCATRDSLYLTVNPKPALTASVSPNPVCEGDYLTLHAIAGDSITYEWTGPNGFVVNQPDYTLTNITLSQAGSYTITITDTLGCTNQQSFGVVVNANPQVTASASAVSLCEGETLQLFASPSGIAAYHWTGPNGFTSSAQNPVLTNVTIQATGWYKVVTTTGQGCQRMDSIYIAVHANPVASASAAITTLCQGSDLELLASPSGMASYTWTGPNGFMSSVQNPVITHAVPANSGTYQVIVSNVYGCMDTAEVNVTVHPLPDLSYAVFPTLVCQGDTLFLTASSTIAVSYQWSGPQSFTSNQNNTYILDMQQGQAGYYSVTVTDANGCTSSGGDSVFVKSLPVALATATPNPACVGQTIQLNAQPDGMLFYRWYGPTGQYYGIQNPVIYNASLADSGTYTLNVVDFDGCKGEVFLDVVVNSNPVVSASVSPNDVCEGSTVVLDGSAFAYNVSPGQLTYSWTGPNGFTSNLEDPVLSNVSVADSGAYFLTVTTPIGCQATVRVNLRVKPKPQLFVSAIPNPVCEGDSLVLVAQPWGLNSYSWTGPAGFTSTQQNPFIAAATPAMSGYYVLNAVNSFGCSARDSVYLTVNPKPVALANASPNPVCEGATLNLYGQPSGMASYQWIGPAGFVSTAQNPVIGNIGLAQAGTYALVVTSIHGCKDTAFVSVGVNSAPVAVITATPNPVCQGGTLNLYGSPNGMVTYQWSGPAGFSSNTQNTFINNIQLNQSGTYTLTVTNTYGCSSTASQNVVVNPTPTAVAYANPNPLCEGGTINLFGQPNGMASYTWTGPNGFTSNQQNPVIPNATVAQGGIYTLTVVNAYGCQSLANVNVIVNANPVATASASPNPVCQGSVLNLSGGPSGMASYTWTGPNGFTSNLQNPVINNVPLQATGTYTLVVTSPQGCTGTASVNVTVNPSPQATASATPNPVCEGNTLSLTASPSGMSSYQWTGPNGFTSNLQNPVIPSVSLNQTGTYIVTMTNSLGCQGTASVNVVVNPTPIATANATPNPLCAGGTLNLLGGPNGMASYSWTGPNGFTSNQQNPVISNITVAASGLYTLTVTNIYGCQDDASVMVTVNPLPVAQASAMPNPACEGATVNLSALPNGMGSYFWSGPNGFTSNLQNPVLTNVTTAMSGLYTLTVVDNNGCQDEDAVNLVVNPNPQAAASATPNPVCEGSDLQLSAQPNGMLSYVWTGPNGFSSNLQNPFIGNVSLNATGTYYLTVTNFYGCQDADSVYVLVNPSPVAVAWAEPNPICEGNTLYLNGGPNGMAAYQWIGPNGFQSTMQNPIVPQIQLSASGLYVLTVTNPDGCSDSDTVNVQVDPLPDTSVSFANGTLTAHQAGAQYQWIDCSTGLPIPGATQQSFTPDQTGLYAVIIYLGACADTSSCYEVVVLGTVEPMPGQAWMVYPNPNRGRFTLVTLQPGEFELIDAAGKRLRRWFIESQQIINESLAPGVYLIRETRSGTVKRIIIQ